MKEQLWRLVAGQTFKFKIDGPEFARCGDDVNDFGQVHIVNLSTNSHMRVNPFYNVFIYPYPKQTYLF